MKDITNPSLPNCYQEVGTIPIPSTNSIRAPKQPAFFSCNFLLIFLWQSKIGIGHPEHGWVSVYNPKGDK